MRRFEIQSDEALREDVDFLRAYESIPERYRIKGLFLADLARRLGPDGWEQTAQRLVDPPRAGRYTAFKDYPQRDHFTIAWALYRQLFPGVRAREGLRRVAREDFELFGRTMIGKVMLTVAGDPIHSLLLMPKAYEHVATGQRLEAERTGPRSMRLTTRCEDDGWEYTLGQVEGIVHYYGKVPRTTVEVGLGYYAFDVEAR